MGAFHGRGKNPGSRNCHSSDRTRSLFHLVEAAVVLPSAVVTASLSMREEKSPFYTPHYHRHRLDRHHRYLSDPGLLPVNRWWWHLQQYRCL